MIDSMRRACATLLATLICFWLIAPAISGYSASTLPACCRPGGKHHCAMMGSGGSEHNSGPAFGTPAERCPFAPFVAASIPNSIGLNGGPELFKPHAAGVLQRELRSVTPADSNPRLLRVRGPPSLLA